MFNQNLHIIKYKVETDSILMSSTKCGEDP